jgi:hypothetical protein
MYAHRYIDENTYQVIHYFNGGSRILRSDQHDYLAWLASGNVPTIEAAGRFLSVVDGKLIVDPEKDSILTAEAAARAESAIKAALREIDISSIRSIREQLAKLPDASQYLKDYEAQAISERAKFKK